jgi:hypothetical protein
MMRWTEFDKMEVSTKPSTSNGKIMVMAGVDRK